MLMGSTRNIVRIGISGWNYPTWRGVFYPERLTHKAELAFASRSVDSIEINGSFYSLLRPESVKRWRLETPDDFVFAVKGSRFITHMKHLRDVEVPLANFFASGVLALEEKLGPILWQLPARTSFDPDRLRQFFDLLPRSTRAAVDLAERHDHRVEGRSYVQTVANRPVRHALEVRNSTFHQPAFISLLRRHRIALCIADSAGHFPELDDVTADFIYVRLHGDTKLYESGYGRRALARWARRVDAWKRGRVPQDSRLASPKEAPPASPRDVYVYFDNDAKVHAPFDAMTLRSLVHREPVRRINRSLAVEAARRSPP